ncbi:uncharacterized protein LOC131671886 [Phymastichus coffea]|uniref:uncharacterized protein LOC131671886 n=1 Tax=Phymastichus coffea TaxID=108790 RepID=UPI00273BD2AA|nr:uncharacterized protein LOC131671886 [Phymastichus coffea]
MSVSLQEERSPFLLILLPNWIFGIGIIEHPIGTQWPRLSYVYSTISLGLYWIVIWFAYPYRLFKCVTKILDTTVLMNKVGIQAEDYKIIRKHLKKYIAYFLYRPLIIMVNVCVIYINSTIIRPPILFAAWLLKNKFNKLNQLIRSLRICETEIPQHKRTLQESIHKEKHPKLHLLKSIRKDHSHLLKLAKQIHGQLVNLSKLTNNIYEFHLLSSILYHMLLLLFNLYTVYDNVTFYNFDNTKLRITVANCNLIIESVTKIFLVSWMCNGISKESMATGDFISELYDEPFISDNTKTEIRNFNNELIQNKLILTIYGCFNLDFRLIQDVISTVGVYLIITVQFDSINFIPIGFNDSNYVKNH